MPDELIPHLPDGKPGASVEASVESGLAYSNQGYGERRSKRRRSVETGIAGV